MIVRAVTPQPGAVRTAEEPEGLSPTPPAAAGYERKSLRPSTTEKPTDSSDSRRQTSGDEHVVAALGLQGVEDLRGQPAAGEPAEVGPVVDAGHDEAEEQHRQREALRLLADDASCRRAGRSGAAPR